MRGPVWHSGPVRVGVLIATYRGERFVADQLRTVLGQTRMPDMVVVTDDGSDDRTVAICKNVSREALARSSSIPMSTWASMRP